MNFCGFLMDSEGFGGILKNLEEFYRIFRDYCGFLMDFEGF